MSAKINLDFYTGTDFYSDGDVEDELLEIVKSTRDYSEILANDNRWPILYHLSPIRQNIIKEFSCIGCLMVKIVSPMCTSVINKVVIFIVPWIVCGRFIINVIPIHL